VGEDEIGRRKFLKRMAAFAFAVPVVSSFVLDDVASGTNNYGYYPNMTHPEPHPPEPPVNPYGYYPNMFLLC
jgi:hypothetical protein